MVNTNDWGQLGFSKISGKIIRKDPMTEWKQKRCLKVKVLGKSRPFRIVTYWDENPFEVAVVSVAFQPYKVSFNGQNDCCQNTGRKTKSIQVMHGIPNT